MIGTNNTAETRHKPILVSAINSNDWSCLPGARTKPVYGRSPDHPKRSTKNGCPHGWSRNLDSLKCKGGDPPPPNQLDGLHVADSCKGGDPPPPDQFDGAHTTQAHPEPVVSRPRERACLTSKFHKSQKCPVIVRKVVGLMLPSARQ